MSKDVHWVDSGSDHVELEDSKSDTKVIESAESFHGGSRVATTLVWGKLLNELSKISQRQLLMQ